MTEKGDAQQLLELLKPTVETNQATLLVGNRVEVGTIQGNKKVGRERGKEYDGFIITVLLLCDCQHI